MKDKRPLEEIDLPSLLVEIEREIDDLEEVCWDKGCKCGRLQIFESEDTQVA